jgi:MoaA/NifB/PqqE/SkfB family radical SAM enzyme
MEDRLREIIISITNRCNLRCAMCDIPLLDNKDELSTAEAKALISDASRLNPHSIVFSGGEPLLREDIFELISYADQYKINTCLTSNGTLINGDVAQRLNSAHIGVVNISVEGPEEAHDRLRGRGSFSKAIIALENLRRCKIETTIATVVCGNNYSALTFVMELAREFNVTTVKFQPFNQLFLINKDRKSDFFVLPIVAQEMKKILGEVIELSQKYKIATNPVEYLNFIPGYLSGTWQGYSNNGCAALLSSCPISADGNVYLCWPLSDIVLGNVKRNRLSEIWNSDRHNQLRQEVLKKGCVGCLMSCYDYNAGKYDWRKLIRLKVKKMTRPKFYKRQYYGFYQYLRYISGKIINLSLNPMRMQMHKKDDVIEQALKGIKAAKDVLMREAAKLEKK